MESIRKNPKTPFKLFIFSVAIFILSIALIGGFSYEISSDRQDNLDYCPTQCQSLNITQDEGDFRTEGEIVVTAVFYLPIFCSNTNGKSPNTTPGDKTAVYALIDAFPDLMNDAEIRSKYAVGEEFTCYINTLYDFNATNNGEYNGTNLVHASTDAVLARTPWLPTGHMLGLYFGVCLAIFPWILLLMHQYFIRIFTEKSRYSLLSYQRQSNQYNSIVVSTDHDHPQNNNNNNNTIAVNPLISRQQKNSERLIEKVGTERTMILLSAVMFPLLSVNLAVALYRLGIDGKFFLFAILLGVTPAMNLILVPAMTATLPRMFCLSGQSSSLLEQDDEQFGKFNTYSLITVLSLLSFCLSSLIALIVFSLAVVVFDPFLNQYIWFYGIAAALFALLLAPKLVQQCLLMWKHLATLSQIPDAHSQLQVLCHPSFWALRVRIIVAAVVIQFIVNVLVMLVPRGHVIFWTFWMVIGPASSAAFIFYSHAALITILCNLACFLYGVFLIVKFHTYPEVIGTMAIQTVTTLLTIAIVSIDKRSEIFEAIKRKSFFV